MRDRTGGNLFWVICRDRTLWLIVFGYAVLTGLWNLSVPTYEAPDEPAHVQYAYYLSTHAALPDLRSDFNAAGLESVQPPLYYLLVAGLFKQIGPPRIDLHLPLNPKFAFVSTEGEANRFLHSEPQWEIHVVRIVSLCLGIVTVLMTFAMTLQLTARRETALLAAGLSAFLPQFTFLAGVVSNDNLAAALAAVSALFLLKISRTPIVNHRDWFGLGIAIGVALLAKSSLLLLLPIVAWVLFSRTSLKTIQSWIAGLLCALGILMGGGWFYLRNLFLYGDLISASRWEIQAAELVPFRAPGWEYFINPFPQLFVRSYFGVFGWLNIFLPQAFYVLFVLSFLISFAGLWLRAWKRNYDPLRTWLVVFLFPILTFALVIVWNITYIAPQGRLMFPALAANSTLLAIGLESYPDRVRRWVAIGVVGFYIAANLFSIGLVRTSYRV